MKMATDCDGSRAAHGCNAGAMGNALTQGVERIVVEDESPLKDYKNASVRDYDTAKSNFDALQETVGDKMTITEEEFDEIFSLICQDSTEHFKLFDSWDLGKVDVMEVFAVVIVYAKCSMDDKIPLLFDLFDFDHSKEISQPELVLLMLCTTRGLCKVVGLDRPDPVQLEELAQAAFASIDRDHNGQISLAEFTQWAMHEPSLMVYLKRFASARLIYDNQLQYDESMRTLSSSFLKAGTPVIDTRGRKQLACDIETCTQLIHTQFPATTPSESAYLVMMMQRHQSDMTGQGLGSIKAGSSETATHFITMDVFCLVLGSYVAFVVADEDAQHVIDLKELKVLLWLMRGKEPTFMQVASVMKSLDRDENGVLSALEWVSYALASDVSSGGQFSLATQIQLLFVTADRNGDALLSIQELIDGLKPLLLESLLRVMDHNASSDLKKELALAEESGDKEEDPIPTTTTTATRRHSKGDTVLALITALANELMTEMDKNQSHRIEWFEFRQHLDLLHERVQHTKDYINAFLFGEPAKVESDLPPQ